MDYRTLLFSYEGRISRAKYWSAWLIWLVVWCVALVFAFLFGGLLGVVGLALLLLVGVFAIMSWIAVGLKRLHDRNKSGWWLVLFYAAPAILAVAAPPTGIAGNFLLILSFAIEIWMFVELGCLRGSAGPNRYGPDPLGDAAAQPA
jgi:uncharacterized membrane protein YhaH (DUF805 family)